VHSDFTICHLNLQAKYETKLNIKTRKNASIKQFLVLALTSCWFIYKLDVGFLVEILKPTSEMISIKYVGLHTIVV